MKKGLLLIPNYPGYFIDAEANVHSCRKNAGRMRKLKIHTDRGGYKRVHLYNSDGKKFRLIHQLVLEANGFFRDEINSYGRHLNGNQLDNRVENLKWGTPKQNGEDKTSHRTIAGHNNPRSKLTPDEVNHIRTCGFPTGTLMDMYPLKRCAINRIKAGTTYQNAP